MPGLGPGIRFCMASRKTAFCLIETTRTGMRATSLASACKRGPSFATFPPMTSALTTRAPAKINLTLHVLGRREDGYHDLESLVVFASTGDTLSLIPGPNLGLAVEGPGSSAVGGGSDNLVLKAARFLTEEVPGLRTGTFRLVKRLPVAAGIGGGSSDAAAALRLLARLNGLSSDHEAVQEAARRTGADVPVCLRAKACMMHGTGDRLGPALRLPRLFAVLVNPRVPVETPAVFKALGLVPGQTLGASPHPPITQQMTSGDLLSSLAEARNDLERPARQVQPMIGQVLAIVADTAGCRLARMSGSGATVFGLYDSCADAAAAARAIRRAQPDWWIKPTILR